MVDFRLLNHWSSENPIKNEDVYWLTIQFASGMVFVPRGECVYVFGIRDLMRYV